MTQLKARTRRLRTSVPSVAAPFSSEANSLRHNSWRVWRSWIASMASPSFSICRRRVPPRGVFYFLCGDISFFSRGSLPSSLSLLPLGRAEFGVDSLEGIGLLVKFLMGPSCPQLRNVTGLSSFAGYQSINVYFLSIVPVRSSFNSFRSYTRYLRISQFPRITFG